MVSEKEEFSRLLKIFVDNDHNQDEFIKILTSLTKRAEEYPLDPEWQFLTAQAFKQTEDPDHQFELYYLNCCLEIDRSHFAALVRRAELYYFLEDYLNCFNDLLASKIICFSQKHTGNLNEDDLKRMKALKSKLSSNLEALNIIHGSCSEYSDSKQIQEGTVVAQKFNKDLDDDAIKNLTSVILEYRNLLLQNDPEELKTQLAELKRVNKEITKKNSKNLNSLQIYRKLIKFLYSQSDLQLNYSLVKNLVDDFYFLREYKPSVVDVKTYLENAELISKIVALRGECTLPETDIRLMSHLKIDSFLSKVAAIHAKMTCASSLFWKSEVSKRVSHLLESLRQVFIVDRHCTPQAEISNLIDLTYQQFYVAICLSLESILSTINQLDISIDPSELDEQSALIFKDLCESIFSIKQQSSVFYKALITIKQEFVSPNHRSNFSAQEWFKFFDTHQQVSCVLLANPPEIKK